MSQRDSLSETFNQSSLDDGGIRILDDGAKWPIFDAEFDFSAPQNWAEPESATRVESSSFEEAPADWSHLDEPIPFGAEEFDMDNVGSILEKLDHISSQHQAEVHAMETRVENKMSDLKTAFTEFRRDTREDIKEIKAIAASQQANTQSIQRWNIGLVVAVILGALGIGLTVIYGSWSILGTLKAFIPKG